MPRDPVARFHLTTGAFVEAVHADADISANGLAQSCGVMVNYRYDLNKISINHAAYANQQSVVASKAVKALSEQVQLIDHNYLVVQDYSYVKFAL